MKQNLVIASIVSTLVLLGSVQYVLGGAVMSVDLGSEWMKVSYLYVSIFKCYSKNQTYIVIFSNKRNRFFPFDKMN